MSQNLGSLPPLSHNVILRRPRLPLKCDVIYGWPLIGTGGYEHLFMYCTVRVLGCLGKYCNLRVYGSCATSFLNSPNRYAIRCFCSADSVGRWVGLHNFRQLIFVTAYSQKSSLMKRQILAFQLSLRGIRNFRFVRKLWFRIYYNIT